MQLCECLCCRLATIITEWSESEAPSTQNSYWFLFYQSPFSLSLRDVGRRSTFGSVLRLLLRCRDRSAVREQRVFYSKYTRLWARTKIKRKKLNVFSSKYGGNSHCTIGVLVNNDEKGLDLQKVACPINQAVENWGGGCITACTWSPPPLHLHHPSRIYYGLQGHGDETINISGMMRENSCNISLPLSVPPLAALQQVGGSKQRGPLRWCWRGDWWSPLCCLSSKHTHSITLSFVLAMSWLKSLTWCILSRVGFVLSQWICSSVCGICHCTGFG